MGKQTLLEHIKEWLAGKCWKWFLKLNNITEDEYFRQIQEQSMVLDRTKNVGERNDNEDMDVKTVEEILKLCKALHDNPNTWREEAGGVDLVRIKLEDILITLEEKKK